MSQYRFTAKTPEGSNTTGMVEAASRAAALQMLGERYPTVTALEAVGARQARGKAGLIGTQRLSTDDLLILTQQLSEMLAAGISILQALEILSEEESDGDKNAILADLSSTLSGGSSLSQALRRHPQVFSTFYLSMVEAGEVSGNVPVMLARLGHAIERAESLRRQLKSALVYPCITLLFAIGVISLILVFGVPRMREVYASFGSQLPATTRMFVEVCTTVGAYWYLFVAGLLLILFGLRAWLRSASGSHFLESVLFTLPIFSPLMRFLALSRFARMLGTLYMSGIPLVDGLELVAQSVGSFRMRDAVLAVRNAVKDGQSLSAAARQNRAGLFTPLAIGMLHAGQEAGSLDHMLEKLADLYEAKLETGLRGLTTAVEPLVIIVVGIMVAFVLLVLGLPFLNMGSLF
jgi:type IV pilus assembly protein PilC